MKLTQQFRLVVKAGKHDREHCPVSFRLAGVLSANGQQANDAEIVGMRLENGDVPVDFQVTGEGDERTLHWIVDRLPANETATYIVTAKEGGAPARSGADEAGVKFVESEHKLDIVIDGEYATSYVYDPALAKPYIGPIVGPRGVSYTRLDFETKEHPHHRSIWLGIGDVNGIDAWNEPAERYGRQIVSGPVETLAGPVMGRLLSRQTWTNFAGKPQMSETRIVTFYRTPANARIIDLEFEFVASHGRVEFGATKEAGPLGIRLAESMKVDNGGTMVNSYGSVGEEECWGQRAQWCDYCGNAGDLLLGIAAFDHPENEDHPTYWHIRNYGLMAPNNLYFLGGKLLKPGQKIRYKYRLYFHEGDTAQAKVADRYQDYIHPPKVEAVKEN
jgi:hypothetical protein